MPTPVPLVESIAIELAARLATITVANGYQQSVESVVRPTREGGFTPEHLTVVLEQGDAERNTELDIPGNPRRIAWSQPFLILLFVRSSDGSTTPISTAINTFMADVMKAICTPADWHTLGGYAELAEWGNPQEFAHVNGAYSGVQLQLDVTYRHPENNPYTVG